MKKCIICGNEVEQDNIPFENGESVCDKCVQKGLDKAWENYQNEIQEKNNTRKNIKKIS